MANPIKSSKVSRKSKRSKKKIKAVNTNVNTVDLESGMESFCNCCGEQHQMIRPGKTQPNCMCDLICDDCGGRIAYFAPGEDARFPRMSGKWCFRCGPF